MRLFCYILIAIYATHCCANRAWFSKILSRGKSTESDEENDDDVNSDEENDEEEDYDEEDSDESGTLELASKAFTFAKRFSVVGFSGTAVYVGFRLIRHIIGSIKKSKAPFIDHSSLTIAELLTDLRVGSPSEKQPVEVGGGVSGKYVCILFDCENRISDTGDLKNRLDYYKVLSNLTSAAVSSMKTVYLPGSKNSHVVEKNPMIAPHWSYLPSSSGLEKSLELRRRLGVRPDEMRIALLDPDMQVISENALELIKWQPKGMPWAPRPVTQVLGTELLGASGGDVSFTRLKGKKLALYFSASWSKPCETFLPELIKAYTGVSEDGTRSKSLCDLNTQVVLVSLDKDEAAFDALRARMPWPAVPFADVRRAVLQSGLRVRAIPALLLFDEDGRLLSSNCVLDLLDDVKLSRFPWLSEVAELSTGGAVGRLHQGPVFVAFMEHSSPEMQKKVRSAMTEAAEVTRKPLLMPRSGRADVSLCTLSEDGKLSHALRALCGLPMADQTGPWLPPVFAVIDLAAQQYAVMPSLTEPTARSIQDLVKSFVSYTVVMTDVDKELTATDSAPNSEEG